MNLALPKCVFQNRIYYLALLLIIPTLAQQPNNHDFDVLLLSPSARKRVTNQTISLVSTISRTQTNKVVNLPRLEKGYYNRVTPSDRNSSTIYWSTSTGTIGAFNYASKQNTVIYNESESSVSELIYSANKLYWIQDAATIRSMNVTTRDASILVQTQNQDKIQGLAIDHSTGTLYYSTSPSSSRSNSSIYTLPPSSQTPSLLTSNLIMPTFLSYDSPNVYWVTHPPGIYFHVTRLNTKSQSEKQVIVKQPHQTAGSLSVMCNRVLWTDRGNKLVWEWDDTNTDNTGRQVGTGSGSKFMQVVAVPRDCDDVVSFAEEKNPKTVAGDAAESPAAISTESDVVTKASTSTTTSSNPGGIRLCSLDEFSEACGSGPELICVVIGINTRPLCLSQQEHRTTEKPQTTTQIPESPEPQNENKTLPLRMQPPQTTRSWPPEFIIVVSVLTTLTVVMSLITLYMVIRVRNLNKKPIIRRRVVVSTRTSESGSSSPASVCEMIDIENCCNMNVCETPCYERTLLNPTAPNTSSTCTTSTTQNGSTLVSVNSSNSNWGCGGSKKEDKRCLVSRCQ